MKPDGLARRGVLVRHLVMPGQQAEAAAIFEWLATALSPDTYLNIPEHHGSVPSGAHRSAKPDRYGDIDRRPRPAEIEAAIAAARGAVLWRLDERVRAW